MIEETMIASLPAATTTASVPDDPDLSEVVDALHTYQRASRRIPVLLSGWEISHPVLRPPEKLLADLTALPPQLYAYAYPRTFVTARERAAEVLGSGITFEGQPLHPDQTCIIPNSSQGILLTLLALREQGIRHAIIAAPCYYSVIRTCQHLGLTMTLIPAADFCTGALDSERIAREVKGSNSVVILTNPAYSIGVEYSPEQLQELWNMLPNGTPVLLDETRLGLHWQRPTPWYQADYPAHTIILRSPSKLFLLNGMKTSILCGPAPLLRQIELLGESLLGSVTGNAEAIALCYLDALATWSQTTDDSLLTWRDEHIAVLQRNLTICRVALENSGFLLAPIDSGPYVLASRRGNPLDSKTLALRKGVLAITTPYFYHHKHGWMGFRINLGLTQTQIKRGLARIIEK
jgi:histidinol-phosphate/aromatic aminotransferase/cobyric acid decarboxylase-like protein